MNKFQNVLDRLECYHLGVKIIEDMGATSHDSVIQKLLDICVSYQYSQLIEKPTRITQHFPDTIDPFSQNCP